MPVAGKLAGAPHQHGGLFLDKGEAYIFCQGFRQGLAVKFVELGLGVKEVELAGGSRHKKKNAVFRLWSEVWGPWGQGVGVAGGGAFGSKQAFSPQEVGKCQGADSAGGGSQEVSPGPGDQVCQVRWMHDLMNSQRVLRMFMGHRTTEGFNCPENAWE